MQWLTAILAFAVTMLIFATIVSTFVEMIHRATGLRQQGLRLMLENLYDQVISKRVTPAVGMNAQEFATEIMKNRAVSDTKSGDEKRIMRRLLEPLKPVWDWLLKPSELNDMPVEVFTQKLADSKIVAEVTGAVDDTIKDIAQKFEAFGDEASVYFERRARLFSVMVALFVAYAFYVHPYNIAITYVKNPDAAQQVAAMAEEAEKEFGIAAAKLDETIKAGKATAEDTKKFEELLDEYKAARQDAVAQTKQLADIGVPVGWDKDMPVCSAAKWFHCWWDTWFGNMPLPNFGEAIWLLIGGLLVGLGAPFWAKTVANLTSVNDVVGKITKIVTPSAASAPTTRQTAAAPPSARGGHGIAPAVVDGNEEASAPASATTNIAAVEAFKLAR